MPEDKFDFSPEKLNLPGSDYKTVRTFGEQLKHIAASNYLIWSPITGEKPPDTVNDGKGPDNMKAKAEIIKFVKDSFGRSEERRVGKECRSWWSHYQNKKNKVSQR